MMDAGLELEAIIIERIFDVKRSKIRHETGSNYQHYVPSGKPWRTHMIDARPVPWFSRDMTAAMQVVEAMAARGFWCQMRTPFRAGADGDGYWAGFTPHSTTGWNGRPDHWTSAETLPLAICLAALKAVEEL
jgi:hypothetical protein